MLLTLYTQVRHKDNSTLENYNCIRCGYVYRSVTSIHTAQNPVVIQMMECNRCGYLWKETWEQPMWRF